uniref:Uncharacterized protein n=1 Tax=Romanomermis culicivorax TaxID=13658 RepID=A0A915JHC2_ROMCU
MSGRSSNSLTASKDRPVSIIGEDFGLPNVDSLGGPLPTCGEWGTSKSRRPRRLVVVHMCVPI